MSAPSPSLSPVSIPASAGIGFRRVHEEAFLTGEPPVGWVEVHSENYFCAGGPALAALRSIRRFYPVSLHGVGLSLGSVDPLDEAHLERLEALIRLVEPGLISEHLSWGAVDGRHSNDLLPLPRTEEALNHTAARIAAVQERLGREMLIENISRYLEFAGAQMPEPEFLVGVARRGGCRLLLDVNNLYVNACNHGLDADDYVDSIPGELVAEIHLAGHSVNDYGDRQVLIDTHGDRVCDDVWRLYQRLINRIGARPTLIEWDTDVPPLEVLVAEARRATRLMENSHADIA